MSYSYRGLINLDPTYVVAAGTGQGATFELGDLNGDGHLDLLVLGTSFPFDGAAMPPNPVRQGRVFLGDGVGGFSPAPASLFPLDELLTVAPRKLLWADFNGDGRSDVFVADHGWDGPPWPGQQNLLFLSTPGGGWRSATATLPQVVDFSHTAAAADVDRDGDVDIFVGNGYNNNAAPATAPYLLINDGQGRFTRNDADVPVAPGQALYMFPAGGGAVHFAGAAFSDLDHDGWPDLVVTADAFGSYDKFRQTTIFWNQGGRFDGTNVTRLAEQPDLPSRTDLDANFADFDGDGVTDIVLVGTNGNPYYDGGYVQVFRGLGQRQYEDVSAQVLPPDGQLGAVDGVSTGRPWPAWVRVGDFNGDLAPDFWVEVVSTYVRQDTPIVWINDGKGNFSVIKASFFVEAGQEYQFGGGVLAPSSTGFQNYTVLNYPGSGGLLLIGRVTSTPYFGRPDDTGAETIIGTAGTNWFVGGRGDDVIDGGAGLDWATYEGSRSRYEVSSRGAQWSVTDKTGAAGVDTLRAMEKLRFADATFDLVNLPRQGVPAFGKQNGFLFDAVYYLLDNPELVPTQNLATALAHFFATGANQGKAPNSWFDATYYENRWPDLKAGNFTDDILFMHYNLYGVWEGRSAGPKFDQFDGNRYLKDNPDVAAYVDAYVADFLGSRTNGAIAHYVIYGQHEQRPAYDLVGKPIDLGYTVDLGG